MCGVSAVNVLKAYAISGELFAAALKARLPDANPREFMPLYAEAPEEHEPVDQLEKQMQCGGCKIGGHPRYYQSDPRENPYQGMTEEDAALWEEEDRLVQEYNQILSRGVPVVVEGRLWTWEELDGADPETCAAAGRALEEERNRAAGEVYRRLVQLRSGIAAQAGFDSYADYAYWVLYSRDYTPEDIRPLREAAKKYLQENPEIRDQLEADIRKNFDKLMSSQARAAAKAAGRAVDVSADDFDDSGNAD